MIPALIMLIAAVMGVSSSAVKSEIIDNSVEDLDSEQTYVTGNNVIAGEFDSEDQLLHRYYYSNPGLENIVQTLELKYISTTNRTKITYISILGVGKTNCGSAHIMSGGVGEKYVSIQLSSVMGYGFKFWIEIWGHKAR